MRVESSLHNNNAIKRYDYLDSLRVFAVFLVLFTHTGTIGNQIWSVTNNKLLLFISLPLDAYRCINTSLFLMISGALLLGKNESLRVLYKKRILRMIGNRLYWQVRLLAIGKISFKSC